MPVPEGGQAAAAGPAGRDGGASPAVRTPVAPSGAPEPRAIRRLERAWRALRPGDRAVLALAGALPVVATGDLLYSPHWTPKVALLLVALPVGLVACGRAARAGDVPARLALAFLAAAALATALADHPPAALVGLHEADNGWWFTAALVACWSLGRTLTPAGRRALPWVLGASAAFVAAVGWLQVLVGDGGRASATMGNPVFFGALVAAGLALVAWCAARTGPLVPLLGAVVLLAGAAQISGSRIAVVAGAAVSLVAVARSPRGRAALVVAALVAGVALGALVDTSTGTDRVASGDVGGDTAMRLDLWRTGLEATAERPLLGWGPAQFRAATASRQTLRIARAHDPERLLVDAHNVAVEYLTTTGLLGLLLGAAWLAAASRRARGPLVAFAVVVGATMLLQPQGIDTTTVALVALGAAGPRPPPAPSGRRRPAAASLVALGLGLAIAATFVAGERALQVAARDASLDAVHRADRVLGLWPITAEIEARIHDLRAREGEPDAGAAARRSARQAIRRDPTRADLHNLAGDLELRWGTADAAAVAYERALDENPWSIQAMWGLVTIASEQGDDDAAWRWVRRICEFSGGEDQPLADGRVVACPPPAPARR